MEQLRKQNEALKAELARLEKLEAEVDARESEEKAEQELGAIRDVEECREVFEQFDADHSGYIDKAELATLAAHLGEVLDEEELEDALRAMDKSKDGRVTFDEFMAWWRAPNREPKSKSGAKLAALRLKLGARVLARSMPVLLRKLSEKPPEASPWTALSVLLSVGNAAAPETYVRVRAHFSERAAAAAALAPFPASDTVALVWELAHPAAGLDEAVRAVQALAEKLRNDPADHVDVRALPAGGEFTGVRLTVARAVPDPLATAEQLKLDLSQFVGENLLAVELAQPLSALIDEGQAGARTLASLAHLRVSLDARFRKALPVALAQLGVAPGELPLLALLDSAALRFVFGDVDELAAQLSSSGAEDVVANMQRMQEEQLAAFQAMGVEPAVIDEVRRAQQAQREQAMQFVRLNPLRPEVLLSRDFQGAFAAQFRAFVLELAGKSDRHAEFVRVARRFDELKAFHLFSRAGLHVHAELRNALPLRLLPDPDRA
jgi:hypothetical protein